jgi:2,3-bisphosphoglycerate-dependent phosphoglycerate mutase
MKWPASVTLIRHGQSDYNVLRKKKDQDPDYRRFKTAYNRDLGSAETRELAELMLARYALKVSDELTPLTDEGMAQSVATGAALGREDSLPDVIFFSPYLRTVKTLDGMKQGWPELGGVKCVADDRIREQEHGLSNLYNDWRIFDVMHPEQAALRKLMGSYYYRYPQGESVLDVRDRTRVVNSMLIRECSGLHVWLVTHHLTILSYRANQERLSPQEFIRLDEHEKPVNCGVTRYVGKPTLGRDGRLVLGIYNQKMY